MLTATWSSRGGRHNQGLYLIDSDSWSLRQRSSERVGINCFATHRAQSTDGIICSMRWNVWESSVCSTDRIRCAEDLGQQVRSGMSPTTHPVFDIRNSILKYGLRFWSALWKKKKHQKWKNERLSCAHRKENCNFDLITRWVRIEMFHSRSFYPDMHCIQEKPVES